jgi:hypothetical protein
LFLWILSLMCIFFNNFCSYLSKIIDFSNLVKTRTGKKRVHILQEGKVYYYG